MKNTKDNFNLLSLRKVLAMCLVVCMMLSTITVFGAAPRNSNQSDFTATLEPTVLRSMYEFIEERPFFYLEPCVEYVSRATLADDFEDNAVIVVLDRVTSRTTSRAGGRDFTATDFGNVGALYVEDLLWLGDSENAYAERLWTAEQHFALIEEGYFSVNREQAMAVEMEYLDARVAGETNTLVNFDEFRRILLVRLDQNCRENVLRAVRQLQQREYVISAVPNFVEIPDSYVINPNDPYFQLLSTNTNYQWAVSRIGLPQAWGLIGNTPTNPVSVGILGHGIDAHNPEFVGRVRAGYLGRTTHSGNGNHQAGIIGASGNNGIGMAGISWCVQLVSLAASQHHQYGHAAAVRAINEARTDFVPIITRSFIGGYRGHPIYYAVRAYTGLFVNSAGNNGHDGDLSPRFPDLPNVLVVGASDRNDNRSIWNPRQSSNFGRNSVHLFAPSVVRTTVANNAFYFYGGTSASAPHVAGVAALLMSVHPDATVQQIRQAILDGVDLVPSSSTLYGLSITNGRLNAYGALKALLQAQSLEVNTWTALRTAIESAPAMQITHIKLSADFVAPNTAIGNAITIPVGRNILLTSNNNTVRAIRQANANQRHFFVEGSLKLGRNITLCGSSTEIISGGVAIRPMGTLTMSEGSVIENCRANFGGAIGLQGSGSGLATRATFNMLDGTIRNNRARWGGGVEAFSNSRINMRGGTIANNEANNDGGGVWVAGLVSNGLGLVMAGGNITNNHADGNGGGVFANAGNAAVLSITRNAAISGNNPNNKNVNAHGLMDYVSDTTDCDLNAEMAMRLMLMYRELSYEAVPEYELSNFGLLPEQHDFAEAEIKTEEEVVISS